MRARAPFASLAIVVLAAGMLAGQAPTPDPVEEAFAAAVDEARLRRSVRELVDLGPRMGGTPSNERSAEYLADYFRGLGLDVEVADDPPKLAHWEDSWRVEFEDGSVLASAWPMGYSPSVPEPVTGELLVIPDLRKAAPVEAWRGRVIYTPGPVGQAYNTVIKSGHVPLAILSSWPHDPPRYLDWSRITALPARPDHPFPGFNLSYLDGRTVRAAAEAGRRVRVALRSHVREGQPKTVVATLRGREPEKYYLICAHGDSDAGGPGADDNASGVATVMEIARVYSALVESGQVERPRYSLRFAIWGSEYHSSRAFIEREGENLRNAQAVINFDETGTGAERDAIYFESNEVPWNETLLRTFERVAGRLREPARVLVGIHDQSVPGRDRFVLVPAEAVQGAGVYDARDPRDDDLHGRLGLAGRVEADARVGVAGARRPGQPQDRLLALLPFVGRHAREHDRARAAQHGEGREGHRAGAAAAEPVGRRPAAIRT
jgi:hypothetical protein